jgi:predicted permease
MVGHAPAFDGARAAVQDSFASGARQVGASLRHRRLREGFVVAEIVLAVVLLLGAGLMVQSLRRARAIDPGFAARNVLTARVALPLSRYPGEAQRTQFFDEAKRRIAAVPGVQAVGTVSFAPFSGLGAGTSFAVVGQPPPAPGQSPVTDVRVADNGYFDAMGVPLIAGRLFEPRELRENARVVIVSETLAREQFPGRDPIGQRLEISMGAPPITPTAIVGVVGDVRYSNLETAPRSAVYWPHPQLAYSAMTFVVKAASSPAPLGAAVQREIQAIDRDQPVSEIRTMDEWVGRSVAQRRFLAAALSIFASLALVLAAVGIYAVMSYVVSQRTSEIGLRLALGADAGDVVRMVVGNAARLTLLGLGVGVVSALLLSATATRLLYATSGADPAAVAAVVAILAGAATLASYLPARRAARIEPVQALRYQ